jgi:hypothetical protein
MLMPEVSNKVLKKLKIVNPIENGSDITSRKRAMQFVQAGRAVFVGAGDNFIRFNDADPRNQAAKGRAASGYQGVDRMLSKTEITNIPFARPAKALREALTDRSKVPVRRSMKGRNGSVKVVISDGQMNRPPYIAAQRFSADREAER